MFFNLFKEINRRDDITYQCLKNVFRKTIFTSFAFYTSSQMKKRVTYSVLLKENH